MSEYQWMVQARQDRNERKHESVLGLVFCQLLICLLIEMMTKLSLLVTSIHHLILLQYIILSYDVMAAWCRAGEAPCWHDVLTFNTQNIDIHILKEHQKWSPKMVMSLDPITAIQGLLAHSVERWSNKPTVVSSILTESTNCLQVSWSSGRTFH